MLCHAPILSKQLLSIPGGTLWVINSYYRHKLWLSVKTLQIVNPRPSGLSLTSETLETKLMFVALIQVIKFYITNLTLSDMGGGYISPDLF